MTDQETRTRAAAAQDFARKGGALALDYFVNRDALAIEAKGHQDFVTIADQNVETTLRNLIEQTFPEDGILGEEHAPRPSRSGFTWVIDPIDGTTNFISAIPQWCVILAVVKDDRVEVGVTYDPVHDEMFAATLGCGASLNDRPMSCAPDAQITRGTIATGFNNRIGPAGAVAVVDNIIKRGGVFHRNASGGLSLAYVASGRLLGYVEEHMNAWDCLAGMLQITEAGGCVNPFSASRVMQDGSVVIAGSSGVFDPLMDIAKASFPPETF